MVTKHLELKFNIFKAVVLSIFLSCLYITISPLGIRNTIAFSSCSIKQRKSFQIPTSPFLEVYLTLRTPSSIPKFSRFLLDGYLPSAASRCWLLTIPEHAVIIHWYPHRVLVCKRICQA